MTSVGRYRNAVQYPTVHGVTKNELAEKAKSTRLSARLNKLHI